MLSAGTAKGVQQVTGDIVASLDADLLDGVGHVLDCDPNKPFCDRFGRLFAAELPGDFGKTGDHRCGVKRLVLLRAEDGRKGVRLQFAEHQVGIGQGQRTAATIAGGTGIGAGRIGPNLKTVVVEFEYRAASGRDRVDPHHGRAQAHTGDFAVEGPLIVPCCVRHIGRGAAHVESDDPIETGQPRGLDHADHATGGAREDRILALKSLSRGQTARGHHELQLRTVAVGLFICGERGNIAPACWRGHFCGTQRRRDPRHITTQDG